MYKKLNADRQTWPELKFIDEGHKARYRFAVSRVEGFVLDAACGVGYGSYMLSYKADVTGVDIEPEAIAYAEEHYAGPTYKVADVCEYQGEFDWVVSFETIEHIADPDGALKNFRKEAQNLIISSPNQEHNKFKVENTQGAKYPHLRHYTPDEFEKLLNLNGWKVTEKWGQTKKKSEVSRGTGPFMVWICE